MKNKKGFSKPLMAGTSAVLGLFIVVFLVSVGAFINEDIQSNANAQNDSSAMYNITASGLQGFDKVSGFFPTIGLVIAAIIVISVLGGIFVVMRMR